MPDRLTDWGVWWSLLLGSAQQQRPDLLLLPELAFCPWLPARSRFDQSAWDEAVRHQSDWLARLPEVGLTAALTTRVVNRGGERVNEAAAPVDGAG